jgi:hypothetical protein
MTEKPKPTVTTPLTLTDVVVAIRQVLDLLGDAGGKALVVAEVMKQRKGKKAAKHLDTLVFGGDGSRRHLERIAAGEGDALAFAAIQRKMDETGENVERALDGLKELRNFIRERYGMAVANRIGNLVYAGGGKTSIRMDLQGLAWMHDSFYSSEEVAGEARRILANIEALNAGLTELHDLLLKIQQQ